MRQRSISPGAFLSEAIRNLIQIAALHHQPGRGQIGRLKMIKRTMFGRASFAPLRQLAVAAT